jgi:murein DD-endopeptidase MepM/ murein hydrolase activator NlpD
VKPPSVPQGQTLRAIATGTAESARAPWQTIRLFPQQDGTRMGVMPVPVKTAPGAYKVEFLDAGGTVLSSSVVRIRSARFPKQNIVLSKTTASLKPSPGEMETVSGLRKTVSDQRHWDEPFVAPVPGCQTSPFGVQRLYNGRPSGNYHAGVDQRGAEGTPIVAAAGGTVRIARQFNIHGGTVGIDHGQGITSTYLHMSKIVAHEAAAVRKGDVIGYVGTTGRSTAPHLHWGIAVNGVHVNPAQWVKLEPCAPARKPVRTKRR